MGYVFISYSTKNTEHANALRKALNDRGIGTWMAPGNIPVGSTYAGEITRALKGADGLVLLLTDDAQNSIWVDKEVERALNYGKPIFPVALEFIKLNDNFELYIGNQQIVPVRQLSEQNEAFFKILRQIESVVNTGTPGTRREEPADNRSIGHSGAENDPEELYRQGFLYMSGQNGHEQNDEKAFFCLAEAADAGHPWAQYYLAWLYKRGAGTGEDPKKAAVWFERAARAGNAYAINNLAECYRKGYGVVKNPSKAIDWLRKGRESAVCCLTLGEMHEFGEGVERNIDEALYYYERAERLGGAEEIARRNIKRVEKKMKREF